MRKLILLVGMTAAWLGAEDVAGQFVGTWKLISYERRLPGGEVTYPFGKNPVGRLTYDAQGHMAAQIMDPSRKKFEGVSMLRGTDAEKVAAFNGYVAYAGTYTLKPAEHVVVHHVEISMYPNWVGGDQRRTYEFSGGRLLLRALDGSGGPGTDARLVWERAAASK